MNALIRRNQAQLPKGGQNPTPLAFFPGVCSGGYLFSSGVQPPQPSANFYPGLTGRRRGVRMLDENIPYVIAEYNICRTRKIVDYDFVFMLTKVIDPPRSC